jgi:cell division protein FtsB
LVKNNTRVSKYEKSIKMSMKEMGSRRNAGRTSRQTPYRDERDPRSLRVIQGGRTGSGSTADNRKAATARRGEIPAGVRRRRRRIATAVMVVLALGLVTYILLGPVTRMMESRRNLARAEAQLAEERSRTRVLEERKAWDMTERFVELEARKMGYVRPGEIPIIVLDHQEKEDAPGNAADTLSP